MYKYFLAAFALALSLASPAQATEARFERTLSISGHPTLHIETGSGNIRLTAGTSNQIHIVGHVKSGYCLICPGNGGSQAERVKQIAANPPIEQTGEIIRIGAHLGNLNNISIDYEIEAPADAFLDASSGSGDVDDSGVGANAKLSTGSGNIHASGLSGGFSVNTGSGDIHIDSRGTGDVRAQTGSGNIELSGLAGGLFARTGSGEIKIHGQPKSGWRLSSGSGNIELWTESSPINIEVSTGSGDIDVDGEKKDHEHHSLNTKLHGGGPSVRIDTGSGDVRIH